MHSRRVFFKNIVSTAALLTIANVGVYTVGSAFKELDGSLVAGAKTCLCYHARQTGNCGATYDEVTEDGFYTGIPTCADVPACSGERSVWNCN